MAGLVELDENDKLIGEDASSDEILKEIKRQEAIQTKDEAEPEPETPIEPEEEANEEVSETSTETEESSEDGDEEESEQEVEEAEPEQVDLPETDTKESVDANQFYRQGIQDALDMLKEKQNKAAQNGKKPLTAEEALDKFAADPTGFINQAVQPYREELDRVKKLRAKDVARLNPEYAKYERIIEKIRNKHPNLINTNDPLEAEEAYLYLAKGMHAAEVERSNKLKTIKEKEKRTEAKKKASSLPPSSKKVVKKKKTKRLENMTSEEMLKAFPEIRSHV